MLCEEASPLSEAFSAVLVFSCKEEAIPDEVSSSHSQREREERLRRGPFGFVSALLAPPAD